MRSVVNADDGGLDMLSAGDNMSARCDAAMASPTEDPSQKVNVCWNECAAPDGKWVRFLPIMLTTRLTLAIEALKNAAYTTEEY